jgi:hypothetical protein
MPYKPEEIIDANASVHTRAHDIFEESFMKFATEPPPEPKIASESKVMPDGSLADPETKGSLETNVDNDTADTSRAGLTAHPGKKDSATEGMSRTHWGEAPELDQPAIKGRRADNETLSTSAEDISAKDSYDYLRQNFDQMASASASDKALIRQNFKDGKPGEYVTRAQTLKELAGSKLGRD